MSFVSHDSVDKSHINKSSYFRHRHSCKLECEVKYDIISTVRTNSFSPLFSLLFRFTNYLCIVAYISLFLSLRTSPCPSIFLHFPYISVSLHVSLFSVSLSFSLFQYISLVPFSPYFCLSISIPVSQYISLSFSISLSPYVSVSISLFLSLLMSLSVSLGIFPWCVYPNILLYSYFSLFLAFSVSLYIFLYIPLSLSLSTSRLRISPLYLSLSLSLSVSLVLSLSLFLYLSLSLSMFIYTYWMICCI